MKAPKAIAALSKLVVDASEAERELTEGLTALRNRIRELQKARDDLLDARPTLESALARVDDWGDSLAVRARKQAPAPGDFVRGPVHYVTPPVGELSALTVFLGPLLVNAVKGQVRELYGESTGITEDDRQQQIEVIERDLLDTEMAEESLIRSAKRAGFPLLRRLDADRRAVNAPDSRLP